MISLHNRGWSSTPIVGVYIPIYKDFPIKGGMTIPDIRTLDLYVQFYNWVVETQGFFIFTPILGEMIQFDDHSFQMG